jgi:hypothetical protein
MMSIQTDLLLGESLHKYYPLKLTAISNNTVQENENQENRGYKQVWLEI